MINTPEIKELPENFGLIYSELLQQCWQAAPGGRGISFVKKNNKGRVYWYLQLTVGNRTSQHYLGAESPELLRQIEKQKNLWEASAPDKEKRQQLVGMLRAAGVPVLRGAEARVLELLDESGIFIAGGVIVGSHAFSAYQQMLGARWPGDITKTMDVDISGSDALKIAVPERKVDLRKSLIQANMGFFEVPMLDHRSPSTSYSIRGKQLKVDVIVPMHGKPNSEPVYLKPLNTYATPVRFLDYLLENTEPVVLLTPSGVLAHVPSPAHFAVHKLVLSQRRPAAESLKSKKDLAQSASVLSILIRDRPDDIRAAVDDASQQPEKFWRQLKQGIKLLPDKITVDFPRMVD